MIAVLLYVCPPTSLVHYYCDLWSLRRISNYRDGVHNRQQEQFKRRSVDVSYYLTRRRIPIYVSRTSHDNLFHG